MTRVLPDVPDTGFATRAIHAGQVPDPLAGAAMPPIYQTSTYIQEGLGRHKGYEYARTQNPTREALERNVASLEGGAHGFAFGSGLAALDVVLKLLKAGDHVVCGENVYGGSMRLMTRVYADLGLRFSFVDMREIGPVERALTPATRLVYCETPTNPMMFLTDLAAVGDLTRARGLLYVVDNTFATPFFQRPLAFGADIVLHSTTKYLNGHSDIVGGLLVTSRDDLAERLGFLQNAAGAVPGPMDCWLALRGIKTLPLRMRQHDANGRRIAQWLSGRPEIARLYYPGLPSHPQHQTAKRQMVDAGGRGYGGMVTIEVPGGARGAAQVCDALRVAVNAMSLGGAETLVSIPVYSSHIGMSAGELKRHGVTPGMIRISVGIEGIEDLRSDFDQALNSLHSRR